MIPKKELLIIDYFQYEYKTDIYVSIFFGVVVVVT